MTTSYQNYLDSQTVLNMRTPGDLLQTWTGEENWLNPISFMKYRLNPWARTHNWSIALPWEFERRAWFYAYLTALYYLNINSLDLYKTRTGIWTANKIKDYLQEFDTGRQDSSWINRKLLDIYAIASNYGAPEPILDNIRAVLGISGPVDLLDNGGVQFDESRPVPNWDNWRSSALQLLDYSLKQITNQLKEKKQAAAKELEKKILDEKRAEQEKRRFPHLQYTWDGPNIDWEKAHQTALQKAHEKHMTNRYPHTNYGEYGGPNIDLNVISEQLKKEHVLHEKAHQQPDTDTDTGGLTYPGTRYVGPGNLVPAGPPVNPIDDLALQHDLRYGTVMEHGEWPYIYDESDDILAQDIAHYGEDKSFLGNLIKAIMRLKKNIGQPARDMLRSVWPLNPLDHPEKQTPSTPPKSPPQIKEEPQTPKKPSESTGEDSEAKRFKPDPSPQKQKDMSEANMPQQHMGHTGMDSNMGSDTATIGDGGGGGAKPECEKHWWGGTRWEGDTVTTFGTRRCVIKPFPDNYYAVKSWDNIPGINIITPWYYLDLNIMSAHWTPANWQTLLETEDMIRPKSLVMKIHTLIFKDITKNTEGSQSIQDISSGILLCNKDSDYTYPYPMGGGQLTVPGSMPGGFYSLPRYSYRTLGQIDTDKTPEGMRHAAADDFHYKVTQNSELFLLEDASSKMLFSGDCYTYVYNFPALPFAHLTSYPWNTRRQDNPMSQQKFLVMDNILSSDIFAPHGGSKLTPLPFNSKLRPAQWLPAPRFKQGEYSIIEPTNDKSQHWYKKTVKAGEGVGVRLIRESDAKIIKNTNWETLQPGPDTVANIVRKPEGSIVLTTNAIAILQQDEVNQYHNQSNTTQAQKYVKLPIENLKGHNNPSDPQPIRQQNIHDNSNVEITYGTFPGSTWEKQSIHLESQIWTKIPNVEFTHLPQHNPLAEWAMKEPPPTLFIRMLQQAGPPKDDQYNGTLPSDTVLNQYGQFFLSYSMQWETTPRTRGTKRWNPIDPPMIPSRSDKKPVFVMNLDSEKHEGNLYHTPDEIWTAKQRLRAKR
ncbi:VP1 [Copiparvovirus ungulate5]|nr:VP1 [Copiparvovirus ungulate5]